MPYENLETWAVIMLCTSSVSFPVQPQVADPLHRPWAQHEVTPAEKAVAEGIRTGVTTDMTADGIIRALAWLQPLLEKWMDKLRGYHKIGKTADMPGAKLADLVTKHMRTVFTEHRKALKNAVNYSVRARDPSV